VNRYRRQIAFAGVGEPGQKKLANATVAICGVGALGSASAERLCRAGIGTLILVDRDWVEWDNLPRQTLYTELDAHSVKPKAIALAEHLREINSEANLLTHVCDLHSENIQELFSKADCIVDGTDNFETRFLINDFACKQSIPWFHAGIVGASGQSLSIVPGATPCFRCLLPDAPPAEQMQTCDSAGVLGPAVGMIANWQALEVMKFILGGSSAIDGSLRVFDLWRGDVRKLSIARRVATTQEDGCIACVQHRYEFLTGEQGTRAKPMCGRNAVQIQTSRSEPLDLQTVAQRLRAECTVDVNPYMMRFQLDGIQWTVFHDGRAILTGTEDPDEARKLYARRIGT
jgi:adenylyltransferase/sulfurtransferase